MTKKKEVGATSHLARLIKRIVVGLVVVPFMILWASVVEDRLGQVILLMLTVALPLPYVVFGRWPPNGRPEFPFEVLGVFEKIERIWSEITVPLFFLIAVLWFVRFIVN
jgi:hypothetical protein